MVSQISSEVRGFIAERLSVDDIGTVGPAESLLDAGILDSTGVLELVLFLESTYGICVEDADVVPDNLDTVDRIEAFVCRKLQVPTGRVR